MTKIHKHHKKLTLSSQKPVVNFYLKELGSGIEFFVLLTKCAFCYKQVQGSSSGLPL